MNNDVITLILLLKNNLIRTECSILFKIKDKKV